MSENQIQSTVQSPQQSAIKDAKQQELAPLLPQGFGGKIILMVVPKESGVHHHRIIEPLDLLMEKYPDEYFVIRVDDLDFAIGTYSDLLTYVDIVYCSRFISHYRTQKSMVDLLHKNGVAVIVDTDDSWDIDATHVMHQAWSRDVHRDRNGNVVSDGNTMKKWKESVIVADIVIVTNEQLKEKASRLNDNVHIVRNALNHKRTDMTIVKHPDANDKIVFGYLGSPTHQRDVQRLGLGFNALYSQYKDRFNVVLGGDMRKKKETQELMKTLKRGQTIVGVEVFNKYVRTFNGGSHTEHSNFSTFPYTDVNAYMAYYNMINVSLVPLEKSNFNMYKSELKMIEAASMGCLMMVSDVMPYSPFLNNDIAVVVKDDHKPEKVWKKAMVDLIENPDEYLPRIVNAMKWFNDNYKLEDVNELRKEIIDNL